MIKCTTLVKDTDFHTFTFTLGCCNYANNIKMFKGVHLLTPRPNMLISLIDQFTIFNGWMDGQPGGPRRRSRIFLSVGGGGGPGPNGQNIGSAHGTNTYVRTNTNIHPYIRMYRQAHECSCTGRRMDIHVHWAQIHKTTRPIYFLKYIRVVCSCMMPLPCVVYNYSLDKQYYSPLPSVFHNYSLDKQYFSPLAQFCL